MAPYKLQANYVPYIQFENPKFFNTKDEAVAWFYEPNT